MKRPLLGLVSLLSLSGVSACGYDMFDQPAYKPLQPSRFYADGRSSRAPVPGTVARGQLEREARESTPPETVTMAMLERGQERYDIHCSPCHDRTGSGNGIIVQRGFQRPPTFHQERLRAASDGHVFRVITRGFGAMYPYGNRIDIDDRWAIVAYVRALQLSQNVDVAELPSEVRAKLEASR
jgi:mono/diheme cytochrome c family protein